MTLVAVAIALAFVVAPTAIAILIGKAIALADRIELGEQVEP